MLTLFHNGQQQHWDNNYRWQSDRGRWHKKLDAKLTCFNQGLRASSLQFTSPLEFNAIFRDGFPLWLDLNGWSKIRDPVTAKFKHARLL